VVNNLRSYRNGGLCHSTGGLDKNLMSQ